MTAPLPKQPELVVWVQDIEVLLAERVLCSVSLVILSWILQSGP